MTIISPMLILSIITNNVCQPHKRADGQETYQNEIGTIIDAQNSSKHIMYLFVKCRRSGDISKMRFLLILALNTQASV